MSLNPTVWIVDDDEDDQLLIRSAFTEVSPAIELVLLTDGDELLPKLSGSSRLPDLILLDVNMTRQNGLDTLEELRSNPAYVSLPVVIFTTSSAQEDIQRSLTLGANHFLTKPLTFVDLKEMVKLLTQEWVLT